MFRLRHLSLFIFILFFLYPFSAHADKNSCLTCHVPHEDGNAKCVRCHRGDSRSTRINVAHSNLIAGKYAFFTDESNAAVKEGLLLVKNLGCRRCHIINGTGNRLAADLDSLSRNLSTAQFQAALNEPAYYMPAFQLTEQQITMLVNAVFWGGYRRRDSLPAEETPFVVHFEKRTDTEKDIFSRVCGRCHKVLTSRHGGLGTGLVAPNISGLYSEFYPGLVDDRNRWTEKNLREWLKNPRGKRPNTLMPPVELTEDEWNSLAEVIGKDDYE